jgi:uncharacterized protein YndB with AHSA1/START domain
MPVTDIVKDVDRRTLTMTARFEAPVERVWALYADPRQLEQVWGPPTHPATFVDHELVVGSRSTYFMTSPEGEKYAGWWRISAVDEPRSFAFDDGFADENLDDNPDLPVSHNVYTFVAEATGTVATYESAFDSAEDLQRILDMGVEEGATLAINQIDGFLAQG